MIKGIKRVDALIQKAENRDRYIHGEQGKIITREITQEVLPAFLHEDTDEKSAIESAQEELDNQLAWDYLRQLQIQIDRVMRQ